MKAVGHDDEAEYSSGNVPEFQFRSSGWIDLLAIMKRWALLVAGLYLVVLLVLTGPALMLAFPPDEVNLQEVYLYGLYWLWLAVMVVSQFALLVVPVRVESRRPVTRSALWPTVLAGGLMAGALILGASYSILELLLRDHAMDGLSGWGIPGIAVSIWAIWSVVFYSVGRNSDPANVISRQSRLLFKGSILELLIAVPTHIVARYRDYCCAGFMTFIGLTMGIAVMLFSFGPAVFFLYANRWKRLHPQRVERH